MSTHEVGFPIEDMELVYDGKPYAGGRTVISVAPSKNPSQGRYRYAAEFVADVDDENTIGFSVDICFQEGVVSADKEDYGINGIQDEGLLRVLIDRLQRFQSGPYSCRENALALTKLEEALHWMNARKEARENRGVAGKLTP